MYLFHFLRCGTGAEDKNLIEIIIRTMPRECQREEGLEDDPELQSDSDASEKKAKRRRKGRTSFEEKKAGREGREMCESLARSLEESSKTIACALAKSDDFSAESPAMKRIKERRAEIIRFARD